MISQTLYQNYRNDILHRFLILDIIYSTSPLNLAASLRDFSCSSSSSSSPSSSSSSTSSSSSSVLSLLAPWFLHSKTLLPATSLHLGFPLVAIRCTMSVNGKPIIKLPASRDETPGYSKPDPFENKNHRFVCFFVAVVFEKNVNLEKSKGKRHIRSSSLIFRFIWFRYPLGNVLFKSKPNLNKKHFIGSEWLRFSHCKNQALWVTCYVVVKQNPIHRTCFSV